MSDSVEREKFEVALKATPAFRASDMGRDAEGVYLNCFVQAAWDARDAWQASLSSRAPQPAETPRTLYEPQRAIESKLIALAAQIVRREYLPSLEKCRTIRDAKAEVLRYDSRHVDLGMAINKIADTFRAPQPAEPTMKGNPKREGTRHAEEHQRTIACHAPPRCKLAQPAEPNPGEAQLRKLVVSLRSTIQTTIRRCDVHDLATCELEYQRDRIDEVLAESTLRGEVGTEEKRG